MLCCTQDLWLADQKPVLHGTVVISWEPVDCVQKNVRDAQHLGETQGNQQVSVATIFLPFVLLTYKGCIPEQAACALLLERYVCLIFTKMRSAYKNERFIARRHSSQKVT